MKKTTTAMALGALMIASGCTITNMHNSQALSQIDSYNDVGKSIKVGMSMTQVAEILGEPKLKNSMNRQDQWTYLAKQTRVTGKSFWLGAVTGQDLDEKDIKSLTVIFTAGKVSDYHYNNSSISPVAN